MAHRVQKSLACPNVRVTVVVVAVAVLGAASADEIFVDSGACPGEGCVYGEQWIAREATALRASPSEDSDVVETLAPRETIETLAGEVHTLPGRFIVRSPRDSFEPGDEVLLYTYLGEGWYRVRHHGVSRKADLGFSPWDRRCRSEGDSGCWGVLERNVQFWWWVKVRKLSGAEGWILDSKSFEKPGPP